MATVDELLTASGAATRRVRELEALLRKCEPQTIIGTAVFAALCAAEESERQLRAAARAHPDHTYDGL